MVPRGCPGVGLLHREVGVRVNSLRHRAPYRLSTRFVCACCVLRARVEEVALVPSLSVFNTQGFTHHIACMHMHKQQQMRLLPSVSSRSVRIICTNSSRCVCCRVYLRGV